MLEKRICPFLINLQMKINQPTKCSLFLTELVLFSGWYQYSYYQTFLQCLAAKITNSPVLLPQSPSKWIENDCRGLFTHMKPRSLLLPLLRLCSCQLRSSKKFSALSLIIQSLAEVAGKADETTRTGKRADYR